MTYESAWDLGYPRPPLIPRSPWPWRIPFEFPFEPSVDICDEGENLAVYVDLPGVRREDVKLRAFSDSLELEAERETPREAIIRERVDRFYRVIPLPCAIKAEQVSAKQENGVLKVTLPKARGRAIEIS
ncbi:MAG: Hsp20/alpha crystallin family protein [Hadesarchaea archaeon]|nr:Hsp20/alpha crystallin family protein [Hadesarchaea archaeon]